jgi:hypothetical protein
MNIKKLFVFIFFISIAVAVLPNFTPIYGMGENNELVLPDGETDINDDSVEVETSEDIGDFSTFFNESVMMPPAIA